MHGRLIELRHPTLRGDLSSPFKRIVRNSKDGNMRWNKRFTKHGFTHRATI